jgi:hypothetical protein
MTIFCRSARGGLCYDQGMPTRALLAALGLLLLAPPAHFEVTAAFTAKGAAQGEVAVTFTGKDSDVRINETPAPRLKLDPGQVLQEVPPAPAAREGGGGPAGKYLDTTWPVVFPVTVARPASQGAQSVKGSVTYFYCSKREGWCRKGTAPVEIAVKLP